VRNLTRLGLRVPYEVKIAASEAKDKYPFAMRLEEVIRVYTRTCSRLEEKRDLAPLAASYKKGSSPRDPLASSVLDLWL